MGWLRRSIASLAALAVFAGLLLICTCASGVAASDHGCCPPTTGLRSAEAGCCLGATERGGSLAPAAQDGLAAVPNAVVVPALFVSLSFPSAGPVRLAGVTITLDKAAKGGCPQARGAEGAVDLVEGRLEMLGPLGIREVTPIVCASAEIVFDNDSVPETGEGFFQLAREVLGGSYTDGAGPGLVGGRLPASGGCPP